MTRDWIIIKPPRPKMAEIVARVARRDGLLPDQLMVRNKAMRLFLARSEAMLECRLAGFSLAAIGRHFDRDHTTVRNAVGRALARRKIGAPMSEAAE